MNLVQQTLRRSLCVTLMLCALPSVLPLRAQKPVATPTPAGASKAQQPAATPAPGGASSSADPGWPREVTQNGAKLIYYQPQIEDWKEYRELTGDMAVSLTPAGGQPALGVASLKAATMADLEKRI